MFQFGLLRNVLHTAVNDVRLGQLVQIANTTTDKALEHKYGKEYTSYATHVLQQLERGESPVPAEGIGLACRAGKSSAWINWQGVMTPCVDMETPAVSLLSTTVSDAWKQIVTKCEQLPFHKECAGCTLRSICDVCYANARNEKEQCGGIGYLCRIAKSKKKQNLENKNNEI